ncbi:uncharacterized protein LOC133527418 isoform X1 [Cydia pomonella]|uniref:uncharacterized protein LOC133527418 isoform X1 n=1 Tax=Cydia pomonella TaxID=82600 RepID=UPI002ADD52CD|nr:uncharacterized protein LOC133527418 isoform X1 [Cydia pomonella]
MRVLLLCLGCLLAVMATMAAEDYEELLQTDTAALLKDESKWKVLFNCLMGRGPCEEYDSVKDLRMLSSVTVVHIANTATTIKPLTDRTPGEDFEILFQTDPKPLLQDKTKWKFLFECLMDMRPCGLYMNVKDALPKLVRSKCEGCTPEQKEKFEKTLQQFLEKYPEDYTELSNKLFPKPE